MNDFLTLGPDGRVADREGKTLEFKRDLSSPTGPLRTIVAFANSAGGRLVIGVDDDGGVAGVADPLAEAERVASLIDDRISPQLVPAIDLVTLDGRTVLVVDVPLSTRRPHCMTRQRVYILNNEKSAVCRGHSQLSVSPPNLPIDCGGAPTIRTSR